MQEHSVIVVLGMHRSGTSVLCKAIESLGVDFGDRLLGGDQWNAKGCFKKVVSDIFLSVSIP